MVSILALVGCNNSAPTRKNAVDKAARTSGERAPAQEAELAVKEPQEPPKAITPPQEAPDQLAEHATGPRDIDERLRKAFSEWVNAKNDADRTAAEARLAALQKEKDKIEARARACAVNPYEC